MYRYALGLEYDGRNYVGWERQTNGLSVQAVVEEAIGRVANHSVRCVCAGRTDSGVHASGQVVHFDCDSKRPQEAWTFGVNANLPRDVAVRWAVPVNAEFHARFSARARHYRYIIQNRASRPAIMAGKVGHVGPRLSTERMHAGATFLLGRHDFSAFRASACQARSPIREIHRISVLRHGEFVAIDVVANAFLQHMVRNLVGSLVLVGQMKRPPDWIRTVLSTCDRRCAGPTVSPNGLYFLQVVYPSRFGVPGVSIPKTLW